MEEQSIELLTKALHRARKGKKIAEDLLDTKASELYEAKQKIEQNEHYLKNVLRSIKDCIFITNNDGIIKEVNRAVLNTLKYTREELLGQSVNTFFELESGHEIITSDIDEDIKNLKIKDLLAHSSGSMNDRIMKGKNDIKRIVSLASSFVYDEENNIVDVVISARDIEKNRKLLNELHETQNNLKEANEKLKRQQAQLVHQEKMASLGQMSAGIAHEINNPIGFINGNLNIFKEYLINIKKFSDITNNLKNLDKDVSKDELLNLIKEQNRISTEIDLDYLINDSTALIKESRDGANRVKEIVSGLKGFVHTDEEMSLKEANINENLESTLRIAHNQIKNHVTVKKLYGEIPTIFCLAGQLNQVFLNLIVNAGQAIESEGEIIIRTFTEDEYVVISIADTGKGIPKEHFSKLFDPFFTTKSVGEGTGLGLSISKGIIDQHQGKFEVKSELNVGTTFTIKLPIRAVGEKEE